MTLGNMGKLGTRQSFSRRLWVLFAPLAFAVVALAWYASWNEVKEEQVLAGAHEAYNVRIGAEVLTDNLEEISRDLHFLAAHSALKAALENPGDESLRRLAIDFANFSSSKGLYDQIRWIDETGMERVRVDMLGGKAVIVPGDKLQNKGKRYFFTDSIKLAPGELFISPLDLNVEGNQVEIPHKPMLRLATPVADSTGAKRGIVILNYYGRHMFEDFARQASAISTRTSILNKDGYWLKSPNPKDEWGFMFGSKETFGSRHPEAYKKIMAGEEGQFEAPEGLYSFVTVRPLRQQGIKSSTGSPKPFSSSEAEVAADQYIWKVVALHDSYAGLGLSFAKRTLLISALLLALLFMGCWHLTRARIREEVAAARELEDKDRFARELKILSDRLQLALSAGDFGVWDWDITTNQLLWDERNYAIYGIEQSALRASLVSTWKEAIHPDDRAKVKAATEGALRGAKTNGLEYRILRPDGTVRLIASEGAVLRGDSGEPLRVIGINRDITESRALTDALHASELRYRDLFRNMFDGFALHEMILDAAGNPEDYRFLVVNPAFEKLTGLKGDVIGGKRVLEVLPGTERHWIETYGRVALTGEVLRYENYSVDLDKHFEVFAYRPSEGQFACLVRDVTERKLSEAALQASEAKFRSFIENSPDGVFLVDEMGRYLEVNPAACAMTGYTEEELLQMYIPELLPPESLEVGHSNFESLKKTGSSTGEFEYSRKGGERRWWSVEAVRLSEKRYLGFAKDTTSRKRSEEALERRIIALTRPLEDDTSIGFGDLFNIGDIQRLQDDFAKATGVASIITHPDGTPITQPSQFCRLCIDIIRKTEKGLANCYKSDAIIGQVSSAGPTMAPCMSGGLWDAGAGISVGGRHVANWLIGQVRDETQSEEKIRSYARDIGADEDSAVLAFREVPSISREDFARVAQMLFTLANQLSSYAYQNVQQARFISERKIAEEERKRMQDQLFQAQKVESIGRLAGGVAHDFNNMLGVILGHTELALEQVGPENPLFEDLEEINRAAKRSADITRQLLAFARKQTITPKVLDLNETLEPMLKMIRRLIGEDIDLAWKPGEGLWRVKIDPGQLDQIVANLATNARDAIEGVGHVTIETGNTVLDEHYCESHLGFTPGEYVTLTVSDDGCGMEREKMSSIFEPFFTTKPMGKGTGLGLATVYGIVKQNAGFINVYSEPAHGASFKIYLPRAGEIGALQEVPVAASRGGTERVLIVEDEVASLRLLQKYLSSQGYQVSAANSPEEALALAENGKFDLLITDVVMPGMNGRDLASVIMKSMPQMRCIFMSGYTANVIAHRGVLDEGISFMQKPYSLKEFGAKVRAVLDG